MIKRENPETEVIMITGHGDMNLAIKSLKFEATDFITKPINVDALEIALKRVQDKNRDEAAAQRYTKNLKLLRAEGGRENCRTNCHPSVDDRLDFARDQGPADRPGTAACTLSIRVFPSRTGSKSRKAGKRSS